MQGRIKKWIEMDFYVDNVQFAKKKMFQEFYLNPTQNFMQISSKKARKIKTVISADIQKNSLSVFLLVKLVHY